MSEEDLKGKPWKVVGKFKTFKDLEKFWEDNFDFYAENKLKTKVIGTTLYVFNGKLD